MSSHMMGAWMLSVGGGILIGVGLSWTEATSTAETKAKNRYEEQLELHKRIIDRATTLGNQVHFPVATEAELDVADTSEEAITVGGEMTVESAIAPDYIAEASQYGAQDLFVDDTKVQGRSYIEAEEYEEEDGRDKEQVTILMGGGEDVPMFFIAGQQVDNWEDLIGDQILVDFYRMVPPGQDQVLYVRNHQMDVDFEVIMDKP